MLCNSQWYPQTIWMFRDYYIVFIMLNRGNESGQDSWYERNNAAVYSAARSTKVDRCFGYISKENCRKY